MSSQENNQRAPLARSTDLEVQQLGEEILIYDRLTDEAHNLSPLAARVWQACDGERPLSDLGDDPEVTTALFELADKGLLVERLSSDGNGMSRRQLVGRMAVAAASAPLILSVTAPLAEAAGSCIVQGGACTPGGTGAAACCAPNTCKANGGSGTFSCKA